MSDTPRTDAEEARYYGKWAKSDFARQLERERDETLDDHRFLLREIFNLTQIGDPHPADLPMRALQAIAEMIDEQWKGQSK
jgi:hypothetical protein